MLQTSSDSNYCDIWNSSGFRCFRSDIIHSFLPKKKQNPYSTLENRRHRTSKNVSLSLKSEKKIPLIYKKNMTFGAKKNKQTNKQPKPKPKPNQTKPNQTNKQTNTMTAPKNSLQQHFSHVHKKSLISTCPFPCHRWWFTHGKLNSSIPTLSEGQAFVPRQCTSEPLSS